MYTLYHNKKSRILEVKKPCVAMQNNTFPDDIAYYNDNYYLCKNRKPLVEKAKEIKQSWIDEVEAELEKIKAIKI